MTWGDVAGVLGALLMLGAYGAVQAKRIDPHGALALSLNLLGALLVMGSLLVRFNLAAFMLEAAWALIALVGLARLALKRLRAGS